MIPSMIWRLPEAQRRSAFDHALAGVVVGRGSHQRPVLLHPKALPLDASEALICQVGPVAVGGHQRLPYGPLIGGCRGQKEGRDHPVWIHQSYLQAVDPLGLGGTAPEGCLTGQEAHT
jgi:hypothetical protein